MNTVETTLPALQVGAAHTDITPRDLTGLDAMTGGFTGVHDPLTCRAIVVDDGGDTIAIVAVDLLEVGSSGDLRGRIERELGIRRECILIAASHSHTAPRVGRTPPGGLSRPPTQESLAYTEVVFDAIVDTVRAAQGAVRPAQVGFGRGHADVNVNRDEFQDGGWVLGRNPDGPSDKTVRVLAFRQPDGTAIATLAAYSVHPTVSLGTALVGADLAGAAASTAERELGGTVLWLPGSIGDQTPRQSAEHDGSAALDHAEVFRLVEAQGSEVGREIARTARAIEGWASVSRVSGRERGVPCAPRRGSQLKADMTQDEVANVDVRVTLLRIGSTALIGIGGEVTTLAAERITSEAERVTTGAPANTMLVSIANERIGYLADDEAFRLGTFAARGCPVQPGWDSDVAGAVATLLADSQTMVGR